MSVTHSHPVDAMSAGWLDEGGMQGCDGFKTLLEGLGYYVEIQ